jgi:hypothetical protein
MLPSLLRHRGDMALREHVGFSLTRRAICVKDCRQPGHAEADSERSRERSRQGLSGVTAGSQYWEDKDDAVRFPIRWMYARS